MTERWQLILERTDEHGITAILLEETHDGLDLVELCRATFGPFDTAEDVVRWLTRHWAPRARLLLR